MIASPPDLSAASKALSRQRLAALLEKYRAGRASKAEIDELYADDQIAAILPKRQQAPAPTSSVVVIDVPLAFHANEPVITHTRSLREERSDQLEILRLFELTPRTAVVPWLESHITLPPKMAPNSAGPFRTALRPFQRPILECWNPDSGVNDCGVSAGVQIAKTTMLVLGVAYRICNSPMPTLIVGSSNDWTKDEISEKRLTALINENPVLAAEKPSDPDHFRAMSMDMSGGVIKMVGGNSPGALSGGSYGIVAIDEASKLIHQGSEQAPEAHPFLLAEKRTDGFGALAFHYRSSTPNSPSHPFWHYILAGDQTRFHVPCPHCGGWFYMDFIGRDEDVEEYHTETGIVIPKDYKSLIWDQDARDASGQWNETRVRETVRYICPHNGCKIRETDKQGMIDACEEKRHNTNAAANRRSFIIPSFYSPTMTFGGMAWAFLKSLQDFFGLQDYYNSRLARPWTEYSVQVKMEHINKRVADGKESRPLYRRGTLPFKPVSLLLNCDPGEATSHWELVAVARDGGIWVCDWGTVVSTKDLLAKDFLRARHITIDGTGEKMWAQRGYIDTGWQQDDQLDVCAASNGFFLPVKGSDAKHGQLHETRVATRPSMKLLIFNDTEVKNMLYANRFMKGIDGGFWLPCDADPEVKLGHTGQKRDDHGDWQKVPRDHYGDCSKYGCVDFQAMRAAGIL